MKGIRGVGGQAPKKKEFSLSHWKPYWRCCMRNAPISVLANVLLSFQPYPGIAYHYLSEFTAEVEQLVPCYFSLAARSPRWSSRTLVSSALSGAPTLLHYSSVENRVLNPADDSWKSTDPILSSTVLWVLPDLNKASTRILLNITS